MGLRCTTEWCEYWSKFAPAQFLFHSRGIKPQMGFLLIIVYIYLKYVNLQCRIDYQLHSRRTLRDSSEQPPRSSAIPAHKTTHIEHSSPTIVCHMNHHQIIENKNKHINVANHRHPSNSKNDDPFFDPKWDNLWQLAELELMDVQSRQQTTTHVEFTHQRKRNPKANIVPLEDQNPSFTASTNTTSQWMQVFETTPLFVPEYAMMYEQPRQRRHIMHMHTRPSLPMPRRISSQRGQHYKYNYNSDYNYQAPPPPIPSVVCVPSESSMSTPTRAVSLSTDVEESTPIPRSTTQQKMKKFAPKPQLKRRISNKKVVKHRYVDYSLVSDEEAINHDGPICGTPIEALLGASNTNDDVSHTHEPSHCSSSKITVHAGDTNTSKVPQLKRKKNRPQDTFPKKLYTVLSCNKEYEQIITWLPHGRSFIVRDPDALARHVFPGFFKLKKYNSFIRQLSLWGFKRMTRGIDAKSYYNPLFLRGKPALVSRMTLTLIKGTGTKLKSNPDAEPDLHSLSAIRPLPESSKTIVQKTSLFDAYAHGSPAVVRQVNLVG